MGLGDLLRVRGVRRRRAREEFDESAPSRRSNSATLAVNFSINSACDATRSDQINEFLVRRFGHNHIILQPLSSKVGTRRRPKVNSYPSKTPITRSTPNEPRHERRESSAVVAVVDLRCDGDPAAGEESVGLGGVSAD